MDVGVYEAARTLLDELVVRLDSTRAGPVAAAAVHPGDMVPGYGCAVTRSAEGLATVRVAAIYPTRVFPVPLDGPLKAREAVEYAAQLEMTVDRCYITPDDNSMPTPAELDSLSRDAMDDAAAMRIAAACTFSRAIAGMWIPRGPAGGIHGGMLSLTVALDIACRCDVIPDQLDARIAPLPGDPRF